MSFRHYTGVLSLHAPSFLKDAGKYLFYNNNLHGADTVVPPVAATKALGTQRILSDSRQRQAFPFEVDMLVNDDLADTLTNSQA